MIIGLDISADSSTYWPTKRIGFSLVLNGSLGFFPCLEKHV